MFVDDTELKRLFDEYFQAVFWLVYRRVKHFQDAEDLSKETFNRIRGQNIKKENPWPYLRTVAESVMNGYCPKKNRLPTSLSSHVNKDGVTVDLTQEILDPRTLPGEKELQELREHLRTMVARLPAEERTILILRYFHVPRKSWRAIVRHLHCSIPTARKKYKHALAILRKNLEQVLGG